MMPEVESNIYSEGRNKILNEIQVDNNTLKKISFTIPGQPFGKQRPKFSRRGNKVITYTPDKTVNYERLIQIMASNTAKGYKFEEGVSLGIFIMAYYNIPKSTSKKNKELMLNSKILPNKKPDWDNIGKIICDSLNSILYHDDKDVVEAYVQKRYSEIPRVEVLIYQVNQF